MTAHAVATIRVFLPHALFPRALSLTIQLPCFFFAYIIVLVNSNETKENNDEVIDQTIRELCRILKKSDDENFIYDFFKCLFTPPELKDFANRWLLVKELDKGTTQREIAKKIWNVSLQDNERVPRACKG